jgi:DNA-binding NtrC family response regulator
MEDDMTRQNRRAGGHSAAQTLASGPEELEMAMAARTDACILLSGNPDAARDLAYRVHLASGWRHGAFTVIDCGSGNPGLEDQILEALFPPQPTRRGVLHLRLVQAGTVLLREVNRLPPALQKRLARQLTEAHLKPSVGKSRRRLIASTSESLTDRIADGSFDDLLFYRLNVLHFEAPDLQPACNATL